jgi:hypothetical protein
MQVETVFPAADGTPTPAVLTLLLARTGLYREVVAFFEEHLACS